MDEPLRIYRNPFRLIAVVTGFLLFFSVVLLDLLQIVDLGVAANVPVIARIVAVVLGALTLYLARILTHLAEPVVEIYSDYLILRPASKPWHDALLKFSEVQDVRAQWIPDTVPMHIVFTVPDEDVRYRTRKTFSTQTGSDDVYFECSNLWPKPPQIVAMINRRRLADHAAGG